MGKRRNKNGLALLFKSGNEFSPDQIDRIQKHQTNELNKVYEDQFLQLTINESIESRQNEINNYYEQCTKTKKT